MDLTESSSGRVDARNVLPRLVVACLLCSSTVGYGQAPAAVSSEDAVTTAPMQSPGEARLADDPRMLRWRQAFFLGGVLLLVFLIAAAAIIHFSMRYRAYLLRKPRTPTPSEDVWAMHKTPENYELPDDEDPPR